MRPAIKRNIMSKYIDADKLKVKIDNLESFSCISEEQNGFYSAISRINDIIDSLQQEQPKPNLEKEIENYTETLYHDTFGNGQGTLDEFDWEDIAQIIDDTARYFYNLNKNEA